MVNPGESTRLAPPSTLPCSPWSYRDEYQGYELSGDILQPILPLLFTRIQILSRNLETSPEAKAKAGVFVGSQIKKILQRKNSAKSSLGRKKRLGTALSQWLQAFWAITRPKPIWSWSRFWWRSVQNGLQDVPESSYPWWSSSTRIYICLLKSSCYGCVTSLL